MVRKKKSDSAPKDSSSTQGSGRVQISWGGALDTGLAMLMKDHWSEWGSCRNKMELCRKWAAKLGISHQDPNGEKTKAHVAYLQSSHAKARELLKSTGAGTKIREYKVGSKIVREELTLEQQVDKLCPVFDVLDSFLGVRVSRVSVDTPCLNGHHGLAGHY